MNPAFKKYFSPLAAKISFLYTNNFEKNNVADVARFKAILKEFLDEISITGGDEEAKFNAARILVISFYKISQGFDSSTQEFSLLKNYIDALNLLIHPRPKNYKVYQIDSLKRFFSGFVGVGLSMTLPKSDQSTVCIQFNPQTPAEQIKVKQFSEILTALDIAPNASADSKFDIVTSTFLSLAQYEVSDNPEEKRKMAFKEAENVYKELFKTEKIFNGQVNQIFDVLKAKRDILKTLKNELSQKTEAIEALKIKIPELDGYLTNDLTTVGYIARSHLEPADRVLLEELEAVNLLENLFDCFTIIAKNPYPWLSETEVNKLLSNDKLYETPEGRTFLRNSIQVLNDKLVAAEQSSENSIVKYLIAMRWMTLHFAECNELIFNRQILKLSEEEDLTISVFDIPLGVYVQKQTSEFQILKQNLITPVQRPIRHKMLFSELMLKLNIAVLHGFSEANITVCNAIGAISEFFDQFNKKSNEEYAKLEKQQKKDARKLQYLTDTSPLLQFFISKTEIKKEKVAAFHHSDHSVTEGLNKLSHIGNMETFSETDRFSRSVYNGGGDGLPFQPTQQVSLPVPVTNHSVDLDESSDEDDSKILEQLKVLFENETNQSMPSLLNPSAKPKKALTPQFRVLPSESQVFFPLQHPVKGDSTDVKEPAKSPQTPNDVLDQDGAGTLKLQNSAVAIKSSSWLAKFLRKLLNPSISGGIALLSLGLGFITQSIITAGTTGSILNLLLSSSTIAFSVFSVAFLLGTAVFIGRCIWRLVENNQTDTVITEHKVRATQSDSRANKILFITGCILGGGLLIFAFVSVMFFPELIVPVIDFMGQFLSASLQNLGLDLLLDPATLWMLTKSLFFTIPAMVTSISIERCVSTLWLDQKNDVSSKLGQNSVQDVGNDRQVPNLGEGAYPLSGAPHNAVLGQTASFSLGKAPDTFIQQNNCWF